MTVKVDDFEMNQKTKTDCMLGEEWERKERMTAKVY